MSSVDTIARGLAVQARSGVRRQQARGTLVAVGDSIAAGGYAGSSFVSRVAARSGRYRVTGNYAVGGTRTDQILATQVPQAIASGATQALVCAGTNDIEQGVPAATLRANLSAIWNRLRQAGVEPIDIGLLPRNGNAGLAGRRAEENVCRALYCVREGIAHVPVWAMLTQPEGTWRTGTNFDTIHPGSVAADTIADAVIAQLDCPWTLPPVLAQIDTAVGAGVILPNAVSFGGPAGALPGGYNGYAGPGFSVVPGAAGEFGQWLRASVPGATSGAQTLWEATGRTLAELGWSVGDRVLFAARARWAAATPGTIRPRILISGVTVSGQPLYDELGAADNASWHVHATMTITAGTLANVRVQATTTAPATIDLSRPLLYNLTKNGL